mgnify:CR=1 FL=1
MEHKNDFIEREVQKIGQFIRNLIAKITKSGTTSISLESLDKELNGKLDFSFYELLELNEEDLKSKIKGVDIIILEGLLKLFYEIDKEQVTNLDVNKLRKVSLLILKEIEDTSRTFSLERQEIKNYFKSKKIN